MPAGARCASSNRPRLAARSRGTILQAGRRKAYRPLPDDERRAALAAALDAWDRGDWFEVHELLEPAWMGAHDLGERLTLQALIKLAAAFVHHARGNPAGLRTNLLGARARLAEAAAHEAEVDPITLAVDALLAAIAHAGVAPDGVRPPDLRAIVARVRWTPTNPGSGPTERGPSERGPGPERRPRTGRRER